MFQELLHEIQDASNAIVNQFVNVPTSWKDIKRQLTAQEYAQLHACMLYAANALYFMNLKVRGVNTKEHPLRAELAETQKLMAKVCEMGKSRPTVVDTEVAKRVIKHYSENSTNKKRKMSSDNSDVEEVKEVVATTTTKKKVSRRVKKAARPSAN